MSFQSPAAQSFFPSSRGKKFRIRSRLDRDRRRKMANAADESAVFGNSDHNSPLITSFCEITSSSREEAQFFLESHNWDLDAAVSTFFDSGPASASAFAAAAASADAVFRPIDAAIAPSPDSPPLSQSPSQSYSPSLSRSPSRSRSSSPVRHPRAPYELRSRRAAGKKRADRPSGSRTRGGVRTLADLNRAADDASDSDSDEKQEYYTGGEKSGMLVQDPTKGNDVESIFNQARRSGAVERSPDNPVHGSSSRSFTGTARLLSGASVESLPQLPEPINHRITFWQNGFTVDDGPFRRLDDPDNAPFLESIRNSECPKELMPTDGRTPVQVDLVRREEAYKEPKKRQTPFLGAGRTIGSGVSSDSASEQTGASVAAATTQPLMAPVVEESLPSTSIQIRLADGTRMVSRFNLAHTIRDVRTYIDASRPGGSENYQLQSMGFPPKQLTDMNQTIEEAGIANSVIIQRL